MLPIAEGAEVTVEANPATLDEYGAHALLAAGANRLSVGVQSFELETLRALGRAHDAADAERAIEVARLFPRWSLDLILAVPVTPYQRDERDATRALEAGARHVSAYCLTLEEGTPLARARAEGRLQPLEEADEADRLERASDILARGGLARYEVSNWSAPGDESRHNLGYWRGLPYVGLGAGAHSWDGRRRSWNVADPVAYRAAVESGHSPEGGSEPIGPRERFLERLMLSLRTCEGAPWEELCRLAGEAGEDGFASRAERALAAGSLVCVGERVRIPESRFCYADAIVRDLA